MLRVYQCENCKKTVVTKEDLKIEGWKELIAGSTDAAREKHVPQVTQSGDKVEVNVGSVKHPMSVEHLIEWVALETEQGYQVKYLQAEKDPVCAFTVTDGDKAVAVYAYCNLHGVWRSASAGEI